MTLNYSFLKDEIAINEIRKHKWIESQKNNKEIGFASAAVDWIQKHGNAWLISKLNNELASNFFTEKRTSRRVESNFPLRIQTKKHQPISTITKDINLTGFSCLTPDYIMPDSKATVSIYFKSKTNHKKTFQFESIIKRVSLYKTKTNETAFELFLHFNENVRNYLRLNAESLVL